MGSTSISLSDSHLSWLQKQVEQSSAKTRSGVVRDALELYQFLTEQSPTTVRREVEALTTDYDAPGITDEQAIAAWISQLDTEPEPEATA